jgi:cytochrome P450
MLLASIAPPADALAAVTHPDPYPFYRRRAEERPVSFDAGLDLWVVAGSRACREALRCSDLRVRPPAEPVPAAIAGTAIGALWREWARMTDGPAQVSRSRAIREALDSLEPKRIDAAADRAAARLSPLLAADVGVAGLDAFVQSLPALGTAFAMGFDSTEAEELAAATEHAVRAAAPAATLDARGRGETAAARLIHFVTRALDPAGDAATSVPAKLRAALLDNGATGVAAAIANAIALLFQSHDATAGWIGNTVVALARSPDARERARHDAAGLSEMTCRVLATDPPVHNTRRFAAAEVSVARVGLRAGDAVLVVLASAPELGFGDGTHRCPGSGLAAAIVNAGVRAVLESDPDWPALERPGYRPLSNVRIPRFTPENPP